MLASYAIGIAAVVLLGLAWIGVQHAWSRAFARAGRDALADRPGCGGGCAEPCERDVCEEDTQ